MITQAKTNKVKVCIIKITNKGRRDENNGHFQKSFQYSEIKLIF